MGSAKGKGQGSGWKDPSPIPEATRRGVRGCWSHYPWVTQHPEALATQLPGLYVSLPYTSPFASFSGWG